MILFPAIDLKEGRCVRLLQGNMDQATIFNNDPVNQAALFAKAGFEWLHVVDLDGAFVGRARNADSVERIIESVGSGMRIQLGGGIRELAHIEYWLCKGVSRVILGTVAVGDPDLVRTACQLFPGRILVSLDVRNGYVAVEGWARTSEMTVTEIASRFEDAGVSALIFTDIHRDGGLKGINVEATLALARITTIPVIASGGLASLDDVRRLLEPDCAILEGAISGRALYDGRLDAREALDLVRKCSHA